MQAESPAPSVRPPVLLGCAGAVFVVVLVAFAAVFLAGFLESGADSGKQTLNPVASYTPGTVVYVADRNFFVVRDRDGSFLALSDLDAANRASATKCRVVQMAASDPLLPELLAQYGPRMSPKAAGSTFLFRESCNRAVYDFTGLRLDAEGPNLDRLAVGIDGSKRLTVDVTKRTCTQRSGAEPFAPMTCPP